MIENLSIEQKRFFLLKFTRELILNYGSISHLREILEQKELIGRTKEELKKEIKKQVQEKINEEVKPSNMLEDPFKRKMKMPPKKIQRRFPQKAPRLAVPKPMHFNLHEKLPSTVQHVKPLPTREEIDLGKLNNLLKDPNVKTIETEGDNEKVYVSGRMGKKPTGVILSKKEIEEIINKFSQATKIPQQEGLYKVVFGNLILTAMISETISSRFVIKKMN